MDRDRVFLERLCLASAAVFLLLSQYPAVAYLTGIRSGRGDLGFRILKATGIFHVTVLAVFILCAVALRKEGGRLGRTPTFLLLFGLATFLIHLAWVGASILNR